MRPKRAKTALLGIANGETVNLPGVEVLSERETRVLEERLVRGLVGTSSAKLRRSKELAAWKVWSRYVETISLALLVRDSSSSEEIEKPLMEGMVGAIVE